MSYVPIPVIVPQPEMSSRARNLSYKLQEAIADARQADFQLTDQDIAAALQLAKSTHVTESRGPILAAFLIGLALCGFLVFGLLLTR